MAERPILFSAPMVRAILDGRKTQTRRVVKHRFDHLNREPWYATGRVHTNLPTQSGAFMEFRYRQQDEPGFAGSPASSLVPCPYGQPGDRLWVRETWRGPLDDGSYGYRATHDGPFTWESYTWRPSIHMPRKVSRIDLEITDVRVERLNDISEADCAKEGAPFSYSGFAPEDAPDWRGWYRDLWEQINGPGSWAANPWVWVIEFKRIAPQSKGRRRLTPPLHVLAKRGDRHRR